MNRINIIRSDEIYRKLLENPIEERDQLFRKELLDYFKQKFYQQQIPYQSEKEYGFDALMLLSFANITSRNINESHLALIDKLDDRLWKDCEEAIALALKRFKQAGIDTKVKEYQFTILIGEESHPAMYLNDYYSGDGGIPGYIFLSLIPNEHTLKRAKAAVCHEVNHNIRYQHLNWDGGALPELIISEGLAENFVEKIYGKEFLGPWVTNINWEKEGEMIKEKISNNLDLTSLNKASAYLYGDPLTEFQGGKPVGLSHGAGYACGYYLVKYYLEKTKTSIEQASLLSSEEILKDVEEFWNGS